MKKKIAILVTISLVLVSVAAYNRYNTTLNVAYKKIYNKNPYLTVIGPIKMADGIARQTPELVEAFYKELNINIKSDYVVQDDLSLVVKSILKKPVNVGKVVLYEDLIWAPDNDSRRHLPLQRKDRELRIAYSMLESSSIPEQWVEILNQYFDMVVVPDSYLVNAYKNSGVVIPIYEVPLALHMDSFLSQPLKQEKKTPFIFANYGACIDRKNQLLLIKAFGNVFGGRKDVFLFINGRDQDEVVVNSLREAIKNDHLDNVCFSKLTLNKQSYLKNFTCVDCYVSLSKGEGFSIQPREAMALGIPVIVSNNTAQTTICDTGFVCPVPSAIQEPVYYCNNYSAGHCFQCNLSDVENALRDVYNNYEYYLNKGAKARAWAAQYNYSHSKTRELFHTLLLPSSVILGLENTITDSCLVTNSVDLFKKYSTILQHRHLVNLPHPSIFKKYGLIKKIKLMKEFKKYKHSNV